jgi:hypothetical protein
MLYYTALALYCDILYTILYLAVLLMILAKYVIDIHCIALTLCTILYLAYLLMILAKYVVDIHCIIELYTILNTVSIVNTVVLQCIIELYTMFNIVAL